MAVTKSVDRTAPVDGVLLLNKPAGITSNTALQRMKRLLHARKAGHTGSLDPAATGMLPLCFGEATKVSAFLLNSDKTYRVVARLGCATDTGDGDGVATRHAPVPSLAPDDWESILQRFFGESLQVPPMYSALRKEGKRLYELARRGEVVDRQPRPIRVSSIDLLEIANLRLVFRVRCSKGTYIRALVEDIAARAGTVAYTQHLHRESIAGFEGESMVELEAAERLAEQNRESLVARLMPPDKALAGLPAVTLDADRAARFRHGATICADAHLPGGLTRVYGPAGDDDFLGVGTCAGNGTVAPKRVFGGG